MKLQTWVVFVFLLINGSITFISCENNKTETTTKTEITSSNEPTLDDKIGQMLMIGFRGADLKEGNHIIEDIKTLNIGGVVLYDFDLFSGGKTERNVANPEQVKNLCSSLQSLNDTRLLISIDQEGGRVNRLKTVYGFPKVGVSAQYLGTLNNLDSTRYYANLTASLLKDLGINFNYAPVVDLNVNPKSPAIGGIERSYSRDAAVVTEHATAVLEIYKKYGIIGCLKHFPGHGSAAADSHLGITDITKTWIDEELTPYKNLIKSGNCEMIMTAHVYNEKLDTLPATLSKAIMNDILRVALGWEGIIISDDMHMGAIAKHYGLEVAIEKAINAGVDILMFSNNSRDFYDAEAAQKAVKVIKKLLEEGKITTAQIDNSYKKIMDLKAEM